ncbi:MAG: 16S rRNA (guanine(527)-N(7))-methyltransferase RsmG [Actinomycetaceae bacterium]|nr:16S rRNA (guanine(527)-N(7))-methyltransferase RsmG [Actinomycetaceae bacterium]
MTQTIHSDFDLLNEPAKAMFDSAFDELRVFADMLIDEGELRGLIGTKEVPRLWSRHFVNSACLAPFLDKGISTVADIGTGAGFPGIVLALIRPDISFTFIESMERRCEWLCDVTQEIGIDNVKIIHARSNDIPRSQRFDAVTSRAVARLDKLVRLSAHLVKGGGSFLALKGQRANTEVDEARYVMKRAGLINIEIHDIASPMDGTVTRVVSARKKRS